MGRTGGGAPSTPPLDLFLESHRLQAGVFTTGGLLHPGSIRDQMLRARFMVDRAVQAALIGPHDPPLLIVGAGAAGVTAALRATQYGIQTVLADKEADAFSLQYGCLGRFICPTSYDWPVRHWSRGEIKWGQGADLPLNWRNGKARDVVDRDWKPVFQREIDALQPNPFLEFVPLVALPQPQVNGAVLSVQFPAGPRDFGMAIYCVGLGEERTFADYTQPFRGYSYWQNDRLRDANFGLDSDEKAYVLISGGGDGALQDFLRAALKPETPWEIYNDLLASRGGIHATAWREAERAILSAETYAQRAFLWNQSPAEDEQVLQTLHREHNAAIADLLRDAGRANDIYAQLDVMVRGDFPARLDFVCSRGYFTNCYALNRFLVLLLQKYFADRGVAAVSFRYHTQVISVQPLNMIYQQNPESPDVCHGEPHEVAFASSNTDVYNVIILRHGIDSAFRKRLAIRQMLPFQAVL